MNDLISIIAGVLAVLSFVPQVIKTYRTKSADDISAGMFALLALVASLWIMYGILMHIYALVFSNGIILIMECAILVLKFRYRTKSSRE